MDIQKTVRNAMKEYVEKHPAEASFIEERTKELIKRITKYLDKYPAFDIKIPSRNIYPGFSCDVNVYLLPEEEEEENEIDGPGIRLQFFKCERSDYTYC
jgi:hypothetical protein